MDLGWKSLCLNIMQSYNRNKPGETFPIYLQRGRTSQDLTLHLLKPRGDVICEPHTLTAFQHQWLPMGLQLSQAKSFRFLSLEEICLIRLTG